LKCSSLVKKSTDSGVKRYPDVCLSPKNQSSALLIFDPEGDAVVIRQRDVATLAGGAVATSPRAVCAQANLSRAGVIDNSPYWGSSCQRLRDSKFQVRHMDRHGPEICGADGCW
jgi:hypothetical protein